MQVADPCYPCVLKNTQGDFDTDARDLGRAYGLLCDGKTVRGDDDVVAESSSAPAAHLLNGGGEIDLGQGKKASRRITPCVTISYFGVASKLGASIERCTNPVAKAMDNNDVHADVAKAQQKEIRGAAIQQAIQQIIDLPPNHDSDVGLLIGEAVEKAKRDHDAAYRNESEHADVLNRGADPQDKPVSNRSRYYYYDCPIEGPMVHFHSPQRNDSNNAISSPRDNVVSNATSETSHQGENNYDVMTLHYGDPIPVVNPHPGHQGNTNVNQHSGYQGIAVLNHHSGCQGNTIVDPNPSYQGHTVANTQPGYQGKAFVNHELGCQGNTVANHEPDDLDNVFIELNLRTPATAQPNSGPGPVRYPYYSSTAAVPPSVASSPGYNIPTPVSSVKSTPAYLKFGRDFSPRMSRFGYGSPSSSYGNPGSTGETKPIGQPETPKNVGVIGDRRPTSTGGRSKHSASMSSTGSWDLV